LWRRPRRPERRLVAYIAEPGRDVRSFRERAPIPAHRPTAAAFDLGRRSRERRFPWTRWDRGACRLNGPRQPADTRGDMSEIDGPALFSVKLRSPANISAPEPDIQTTFGDVRSLDAVARLVERAKDGDKDAFGQIFRLHRDAILRFARLRLGPEADDVVSEVFTRAWVTLNRYEYT